MQCTGAGAAVWVHNVLQHTTLLHRQEGQAGQSTGGVDKVQQGREEGDVQ